MSKFNLWVPTPQGTPLNSMFDLRFIYLIFEFSPFHNSEILTEFLSETLIKSIQFNLIKLCQICMPTLQHCHYEQGLEYTECIHCREVKTPFQRCDIKLYQVVKPQCWSSGKGRVLLHCHDSIHNFDPFIVLTPKPPLSCYESTCYGFIYGSNSSVSLLFVFDRNIWNLETAYKYVSKIDIYFVSSTSRLASLFTMFQSFSGAFIVEQSVLIVHSGILIQIGWACRIHRGNLCRGVRPHLKRMPGYDIKPSDGLKKKKTMITVHSITTIFKLFGIL